MDAYEKGYYDGLRDDYDNPYAEDTFDFEDYEAGFDEGSNDADDY